MVSMMHDPAAEKKRKTWYRCSMAVLLAAALLLSGCTGGGGILSGPVRETDSKGRDGSALKIVTTIFPQYDFVRQIAGERVSLQMLLKPGEETHSYEPTPRDIIAIQNEDLRGK